MDLLNPKYLIFTGSSLNGNRGGERGFLQEAIGDDGEKDQSNIKEEKEGVANCQQWEESKLTCSEQFQIK